MLGKNFTFNGLSIPYTKEEGMSQGWYADVIWKNISIDTFTQGRQDYHGIIASPSLARGRVITIRGQIFATNKLLRGTIRKLLDTVFVIEPIPIQGEGLYPFQFIDDDEVEWQLQAQVFRMPEYDQDRGSTVINFSLDLLAPNPIIQSQDKKSISGIYGMYGGITLPHELPFSLSSAVNYETAENEGNFAASALITITGDIVNPKILNLTNGRFWKQNRTLSGADELVLNTNTGQVTYNGVNDLASRADGSNWQFVNPGINHFVLLGDDFDVDNQDKAGFTIEFYDTML